MFYKNCFYLLKFHQIMRHQGFRLLFLVVGITVLLTTVAAWDEGNIASPDAGEFDTTTPEVVFSRSVAVLDNDGDPPKYIIQERPGVTPPAGHTYEGESNTVVTSIPVAAKTNSIKKIPVAVKTKPIKKITKKRLQRRNKIHRKCK